jgi:hypothetical protein
VEPYLFSGAPEHISCCNAPHDREEGLVRLSEATGTTMSNREGTATPDFSDMSIALVCMVALQHRRRGWRAGSDSWRLDDLVHRGLRHQAVR